MAEATRQHYQMATGKGLQSPPPSKPSPGYAKGGAAKNYSKGGSKKK